MHPQPAPSAAGRDDPRPGVRDREQLRHRRGASSATRRQLEEHRGYLGLSWVAVWVVLFTIVVPTSPRRALLAALASVSSVAVVVGLVIASGATSLRLDPAQFFFGLVFPYLLVVGMA